MRVRSVYKEVLELKKFKYLTYKYFSLKYNTI